jgi:hypothetical protein
MVLHRPIETTTLIRHADTKRSMLDSWQSAW